MPTGPNWYYEGDDSNGSAAKAIQALGETWLAADWFVTFTWSLAG